MIRQESAAALIQLLNQTDEQSDLEAKRIGENILGHSVYETIISLSNEPDLGGGTILLGVTREDEDLFPHYSASGVSDPDKLQQDLASGCAGRFNQPIRIKCTAEIVAEKTVSKIDVPEISRQQKPLFFKDKGLPAGAFRRVGTSDIRFTTDDLAVIFQTRADNSYDINAVDGASFDDIDPNSIQAYRNIRKSIFPDAEELNWNDEELLHAFGGLQKHDGEYHVTVTGLLVFGKSASLRRIYPAHRVDYIRVVSVIK